MTTIQSHSTVSLIAELEVRGWTLMWMITSSEGDHLGQLTLHGPDQNLGKNVHRLAALGQISAEDSQ